MAQHLAIVADRGLVAGVATGKIDIQVQWFDVQDEAAVRSLIESEPIQCYHNSNDELVSWELVEIFAVEEFVPTQSGEEVIGFIASTQELQGLVGSDDESDSDDD